MKEKYLDDLKEIRHIMERSSRFISLSGWSGIVAGIIALLSAYGAYKIVYAGQDYLGYRRVDLHSDMLWALVGLAAVTIVLSVGSAIYFTTRKARAQGVKIWDAQTRNMLYHFSVPLVSGGILCLILLLKGYVGLMAPLTLIFYGLALFNVGKYTLTHVETLGLMEVGLGLLATLFIGYGLLFWALGFGVFHIVYGIIMQLKSAA